MHGGAADARSTVWPARSAARSSAPRSPTRPRREPATWSTAGSPRGPDRLWVADITYVSTWSGGCYVAFVIDAYARRIMGWRCGTTMTTQLVLDALEQAVWTRQREGSTLDSVVAHTDRGSQGGFNRWSQHLLISGVVGDGDGGLEHEDQRCSGGCASAVACGSCASSGDAFAWAA